MLRIRKAQNEELTRRVFHNKLYRFLRRELPEGRRPREGSLAEVSALWSKVPFVKGASEHSLAVYMAFLWLSTSDAEVAKRLLPAEEALRTRSSVFAMRMYMYEAGILDINAFDRG